MAPPMTPPAMSPIVAGSAGAGAVTSATGIPLASVAAANGAAATPGSLGRAGTALVPIADAGVATAPLGSSWMAPRIPPQL